MRAECLATEGISGCEMPAGFLPIWDKEFLTAENELRSVPALQHVEDVQDLECSPRQAHDLAVDRNQDCSWRRRGKFHDDFSW